MLKLEDFFHLPQLDTAIEQVVADGPGLTVVAGFDPRLAPHPPYRGTGEEHPPYRGTGEEHPPYRGTGAEHPPYRGTGAEHLPYRGTGGGSGEGFLPSGRSAFFRILMREILMAHPSMQAVVVTEDRAALHIPRQLRRRVELAQVLPPLTYPGRIAEAARRRPGLLVVDELSAETAPAALEAAQEGVRVLSQLDTVFRGAGVATHLLDLGVARAQLAGLSWIVTVQRLPTLCPRCKEPAPPRPGQLARLRSRYPGLADLLAATFFQPAGCPDCHATGRHGDLAAFDVFRVDADVPDPFEQPSLLSLEEYILRLAALGYLPLDDLLHLETDQLGRVYNLLTTRERTLADARVALESRLAQLEAANRVLQQRTEALISLQDIGQTLITSTDLDDLAARVCRHARKLCGADRAILYFLRSPERAEVLAVGGWDRALIHQQVDTHLVCEAGQDPEPAPFTRWPPGVPISPVEASTVHLRAGLRVPLVAQQEQVGLMIIHTTRKSRFAPGEVALLQTFASQAAVAMQRAGLIEQLRAKIAELEAAQAELVQKERMEREMELARQVQQSVLPRIFPLVPGYTFAARNEPARRVGGDLYDVILLDADRFGVVVADVSDKGLPAALYMALTRSLLLAEARRARSPRQVLTNVNRLLLELGEPNMFVTVFYGVVEGTARQLTYTRAGHDRPILLREGTAHELGGQGAFLGFLGQEDLHLSEEQITLAPGDRLVLYTDGLTDVLAPDNRPFGLGRLKSLLESHAALSPARLCEATFADLAAYQDSAEQYDDMTMLVVAVA